MDLNKMDGSYFIFNGICSLDKKIMVNKLPPFELPQANIEKIVIPGRDGFLTHDYGTYSSTLKPCECSLDNGFVDDLGGWLKGSGDVIFSNEPDKIYKATIIENIPFTKIIEVFRSFIIHFECQPHKRALYNEVISLTTPGQLNGMSNANSKPIITVYGTGLIDLSVNGIVVHLKNVVTSVTIDSELMDAYKDTVLKNGDMEGEFPELIPGSNAISWTGTVSKVEIKPNWRWI